MLSAVRILLCLLKKDLTLLFTTNKIDITYTIKIERKKYVNKVTERESKFCLNDFHIIHQIWLGYVNPTPHNKFIQVHPTK